jgi:2',3'-cyclic-nucleotide 2'-phosphodiesterase (5'-nucleotidase family)
MTLTELYQEMQTALESSVDAATTDRLTVESDRYAKTVGWAEGVIDKDGRILEAFDKLRITAFRRFEQTQDPNIAAMHDALARFILAVSTHDEDLAPAPENDDLGHDV